MQLRRQPRLVIDPELGVDTGAQFVTLVADLVWAVIFAIAVLKLTGRAPVFVPVTVFTLTALFPIVVLCWITLPNTGTWSASANTVISAMYRYGLLWGAELFIPTFVSALLTSPRWRRSSGA